MEVFTGINPEAPLIVAEAVWQYSHHILHGLTTHKRPHSHGCQLVGNLARTGRHASTLTARLPRPA